MARSSRIQHSWVEGTKNAKNTRWKTKNEKIQTHTTHGFRLLSRARITHPIESQRDDTKHGIPEVKDWQASDRIRGRKRPHQVEFPIGRDRAVEFLTTKRSLTRRGLVQLPESQLKREGHKPCLVSSKSNPRSSELEGTYRSRSENELVDKVTSQKG